MGCKLKIYSLQKVFLKLDSWQLDS
jgi:hypothetical protein